MTKSLVVDASFAVRLILHSPEQAPFRDLAEGWQRDGVELYAPTLWLYELTSALRKLMRAGELAPAEARQALALAQQLGVELVAPDDALAQAALEWTVRLNLGAAYDSSYLALAEALQCELWTADRHLCRAVDLAWVCCVGEH